MNPFSTSLTFCAALSLASAGLAANVGSPFYGDAPDEHHPWAVHDPNRPQPKVVTPGTFSSQAQPGMPPADAVILFDGTDVSKWEADEGTGVPTKWVVKNGAMECVPGSGYVRTKEHFGDCQLHVEWAAPAQVKGNSQGRGNSGVFLMGLVEIQVLDNYDNPTYPDGFAGSVYGVNPPLANALRPPGQFQTYDIVFRRPVFKDGQQLDPGYITVFENGVLVQDHTPLEGNTGHMSRSKPREFPAAGPLKLQDHGNPVRYRNIWYRPLPPRAIEGGTDGYLTPEATMAKRKEIAATLRNDAAKLPADSSARMLRLAESLVYEKDASTYREVEQAAERYIAALKSAAPAELEKRKGDIQSVTRAFRYLAKWKIAPANFAPLAALDRIEKAQGWDKEKK